MRQLSYEDFLKILAVHQPVRIRDDHIALAEKESSDEPELVIVGSYYPTIKTQSTGGYILPSDILPWRFRDRLVQGATGTRIYGNQHGMIEEMVSNAIEHGNKFEKTKSVYLLWHMCQKNRTIEVFVVDGGEKEFDLEERIKARRSLSASFGKYDDYSGTDLLRRYSKRYEYFTILSSAQSKKGTLLWIALGQLSQDVQESTTQVCNYAGHRLFQ